MRKVNEDGTITVELKHKIVGAGNEAGALVFKRCKGEMFRSVDLALIDHGSVLLDIVAGLTGLTAEQIDQLDAEDIVADIRPTVLDLLGTREAAIAPKRTPEADGSVAVPLAYPIKGIDGVLSTLKLNRPKGKQFRNVDFADMDHGANLMRMIGDLSLQLPAIVDQLDAVDIVGAIRPVIFDFFGVRRPTGGN